MDKNKTIETAAKLAAKGAYDRAIKEYQKVSQADPTDVRVLQKMGELYQKKNDNLQAADCFVKVAEGYARDGFHLKAVALYKQVLKLNPSLLDVNLKLAELHQHLGLLSEAMAYFQIVANAYDKAGDTKSSLDTLKRMVDLDPENVASKLKLAELYAREGMVEPAASEFRRALEYLKRAQRSEDYFRVAERLSALVQDDLPLAKELARYFLSKGDQKRALAKLQWCFKANPKEVETLLLLGEAFEGLGQTAKAVSVYKELAGLYAESGAKAEVEETWNKVARLAPDDPDLVALRRKREPARPAASTSPVTKIQAPPPVPASTSNGRDVIGKLLTETEVYVKYGLQEKALEHLGKVFAIDPENLDAHEKAYQIYAAAGHRAAFDQLLNVLRLCARKGEVQRAQSYLDTLLAKDPNHAETPVFLAVLRPSETGSHESELALEEAMLVDAQDEELVPHSSGYENDLALQAADEAVDEDIVDEELSFPSEPADLALELVTQPEGNEEVIEEGAPELPDSESDSASEELDEAEFFLSQGLALEAEEIIETVLIAYPDNRRARSLKTKLSAREGAPSKETFDLAAELAGELGDYSEAQEPLTVAGGDDFQYSVEEVFAEFKKGLEKVVKPEDVDTHYDLGIAYKEMGLVDDAIHEFSIARQGCLGQKKELDCLTMIGLLHALKAETAAAVDAFKRALQSEHAHSDAVKGLHYELGTALESMGEPGKALYHFQKVAQLDSKFRDVNQWVNRLSAKVKAEDDSMDASENDLSSNLARKVGYV